MQEEAEYAAFFWDFFQIRWPAKNLLLPSMTGFFKTVSVRGRFTKERGKKTTLLQHLFPGGHWLKSWANHSQHERSNTDIVVRDWEIIAPGISTASKLDFIGLLQTVGDHLLNPECCTTTLQLQQIVFTRPCSEAVYSNWESAPQDSVVLWVIACCGPLEESLFFLCNDSA